MLLSLLFACNDHRFPDLTPSRLRIKTLTEVIGSSQLVSEFFYNPQGRLSNIKTHRTDAERQENTIYLYDNQNRLSQIQRVVQTHLTNDPPRTKTDTYSFSYTIGGQIAQILYTNDAADSLNFICKPIYNSTNQIIGNQVQSYNGYQSIQFSTQFIYAGGNIKTARITFLPTNQISEIDFSYDNKPNPFYGIVMPIATLNLDPVTIAPVSVFVYPPKNDGIANLMSLCANNITSDGYSDFIYTYNSAGLPTSRTSFRSGYPDRIVTATVSFDYELY
ncbi:MAG: hypothetical protein BGO59_28810 [Spirosoma sp. 48-14]|nr:MAG: hypothetical protein BGO59_28810 [Spirosoma sp. 48-14]